MGWPRSTAFALLGAAMCIGAGTRAHAGASTHVVEHGDTLWELARDHGCSVEVLRKANSMDDDDPLVIGRRIDLSVCSGSAAKSKSKSKPKSKSKAKSKSEPKPEPKSVRRYTVVAGDSLARIAQRQGTSVQALRDANGIEGSLIKVGQVLVVPGDGPRSIRVRAGQSRGRPDHGWLAGPARLPQDGAYYRRRTERTYASAHLIDYTRNAIDAARAEFPKLHRLAIGDLSDKDGGPLSGHASHQSGRDIDVGFYFRRQPKGYPSEFIRAKKDTLHADATWALLEAFVRTAARDGGVEKIFLDYEVQGWLYAAARRDGWSKRKLLDVFQYPDGRWAKHGIVRHEPNHADHLHVRFRCAPNDETCQ